MEDEVEVDVLGDFNLENLLTKNEPRISCYDGENNLGLNCEYSSVTSQWLLDSASQSCWFDKSEDRAHYSYANSQSTSSNSAESTPSIDVCGWSDKERYLLEKGLELFGRSWSRLAQYIGSKTPQQVKTYVRSMGIDYSLLSSEPVSVSSLGFGVDNSEFNFTELINDMEIPASIEEVIEVVSTAQPTVQTGKTITRQRQSSRSADNTVHPYKATGKEGKKKLDHYKIKQNEKKSKQTEISNFKRKIMKESHLTPFQLLNNNNEGRDIIVLPSGEEIIRIQRESVDNSGAESDIEVDVDSDCNEIEYKSNVKDELSNPQLMQVFKEEMMTPSGKIMTVIVDKPAGEDWLEEKPVQETKKQAVTLSSKYNSIIQERLNAIYKLPPPEQELEIYSDQIVEEEERLHPEFFGQSHNKRKRYLKIRNHIIDCWKSNKPKYVTKTAVRSGLKNCGDVRLITRIHVYLEQRGYINFGCDQCHYKNTNSEEVMENATCKNIPLNNKSLDTVSTMSSQTTQFRGERRAIKKKRVFLESSSEDSEDCGYTMVHMDSGEMLVQHLPKTCQTEEKRHKNKSKAINLIRCKKFTTEYHAPFSVKMEISALMLINIHSLASPNSEVIGLLGGTYDYEHKVLTIMSAVPCKTTRSSSVHCDMCPVSEFEGSQKLAEEKLSIVGWYHSHPNFPPNPSDTDLETQNSMQTFFNNTSQPFIGFILAPYFQSTTEFRCIVVREVSNKFTPFNLHVMLCYKNLDFTWLKCTLEAAFATLGANCLESLIPETFINKCLRSIKHHLKAVIPKVEEERVEELASSVKCLLTSLFAKNSS